MGKAANNERIKLQATWFNNASVGTTLGSILIPSWSLPKVDDWLDSWPGWGQASAHDRVHVIAILTGFATSVIAAYIFRVKADELMAKIQD